jgi:hypothetical protein
MLCSCDLCIHWPELGARECLGDDGFDAILAERAHQRVGNGDFV